jgi:hypothetical protein
MKEFILIASLTAALIMACVALDGFQRKKKSVYDCTNECAKVFFDGQTKDIPLRDKKCEANSEDWVCQCLDTCMEAYLRGDIE